MLKRFGSNQCPRCNGPLRVDGSTRTIDSDQRWLCAGCGFSRPMTYAVVRPKDLTDLNRRPDRFLADSA